MAEKKHKISCVEQGSIAEEMGICPGDQLIHINDHTIEDVFDYHYYIQNEFIEVLVEKEDGEEWLLEIEKDQEEDLGIQFGSSLMDEYKSCHNKCMFCFIDQMPEGMRDTLYFKDDDTRLSFLQGNYVTLTNLKDADIERIIEYKLSPINISVQTTNPELRCKMLHNRFAGEALKKMDRLFEAGIEMNGQIVLCKGVNDGAELDRSIRELSRYIPYLRSVSVVPVGLTKFRKGLYPLEPFTKEEAEKVLELIHSWQEKILPEKGIHFIHGGDEWYLLAGMELPKAESYDGYLQLENGVGMLRLLEDEFDEAFSGMQETRMCRHISIATGVLAEPVIRNMSEKITEKAANIKIEVYPIKNEYFGEHITVSGLLTGRDILSQLKGRKLGDRLLLPENVLKNDEDVFLDDMTLGELKEALQVEIDIVKSSGADFIEAIILEEETSDQQRMGE